MLFMQKERNMSEYIDFITYQDDAIIQRPLTLLQKKRTTASTTEGRPSSEKQAPRSMIFLKSLAISRILCTFVGNYNIKIKQLWSY